VNLWNNFEFVYLSPMKYDPECISSVNTKCISNRVRSHNIIAKKGIDVRHTLSKNI